MIIPAGVIRCNTMNPFNYKTVNINNKAITVKIFQKSLAVINSRRVNFLRLWSIDIMLQF